MAKPGDVVDVPQIGLRFEFRATAESTAARTARSTSSAARRDSSAAPTSIPARSRPTP